MEYLRYDLRLAETDIVEVTLDRQANVRLLDAQNFALFANSQAHRFHGGLAKKSPLRLRAPSAGSWHLVIDLGGYTGQVRASVRTLRA
jgi:hypothetical protein